MIEIERKFLVKDTIHEVIALIRPHQIIQAYLVKENEVLIMIEIERKFGERYYT